MAPVFRSGLGTSKGELVKLAQDLGTTGTVTWQGRVFPKCADVADIPEAWPAQAGMLPHLHGDWEKRSPRAAACDQLEDEDPEGDDGLEARGEELGKRREGKD